MPRNFDAEARTWDENEPRLRMSMAIADAIAGALALPGGETILDYGTGTGIVALRLAPAAKQVICADAVDPDGGEFHADNTGVEHFGFDRARLAETLGTAGFEAVATRTAATVRKPNAAGVEKEFSTFVLTASRPAVAA